MSVVMYACPTCGEETHWFILTSGDKTCFKDFQTKDAGFRAIHELQQSDLITAFEATDLKERLAKTSLRREKSKAKKCVIRLPTPPHLRKKTKKS